MENTETLGDFIRRRMKETGIKSASELAQKANISHTYASHLMYDTSRNRSGIVNPSADVLVKLSKALQSPIEDILAAAGFLESANKTKEEVREILSGVSVAFHESSLDESEKEDIIAIIKTIILGKLAQKKGVEFK